jgi:hypothetical protein
MLRAWAALVRKELRQLMPLILGLAAVILWSELDSLVLHPPDVDREVAHGWLLNSHSGQESAMVTLLIGLIIAYNLLPGEHDQRTIDFLYTLPLRRRTVFLTKYAVGCGLLVVANLSGSLLEHLQQGLLASSFARALVSPHARLLELGTDVALPFIVVAYGMLLSFFRRLGWILFLLTWLFLEVAERVFPPLRALNVKTLLDADHHGLTPRLDGRAWLLHGVMAALSLALAARFWLSDHEGFAGFYERLRKQAALRRVGVILGLLAAALVSAAIVTGPFEGPTPDRFGGGRTVVFETQHFHFTYRAGREEQARIVISEADRAYQRVRQWLPGTGGPIVADLTEASSEHLGIAGWQKMRIDLRPKSPALLRHVLYHETTHVLATLASEVPQRQAQLRFFGEGLAEYVAYELNGEPGPREHARLIAALARSRFQIHVEDLMDPATFVARHDEFLLYALGEVWVAGLVDACGPTTPAKVVATFGDPALPTSLNGPELWRVALQQNKCDLDRVMSRYEQRLRKLEPQAGARLPVASARPRGEEEGKLVFEVSVTAPTPGPWSVTLRLRDDASSPPADWMIETATVATGETELIRVDPPARGGRTFEMQVGAAPGPDARAFYTRWRSVTRD